MKPIVAANWKMNFTINESVNLIDEIIKRSPSAGAEIIFFPNYISLQSVKQKLVDTAYMVGSQNVHHDESGAFTGEVSASMLSILDLDYVITGHSERRQFFNESDDQVNQKIKRALDVNIKPVVCIGETIDERNSGKTTEVLNRQLNKAFEEVDVLSADKIIVAYEPVWAIGTGVSADESQVLEAHALIKQTLASIFSENIPILYGGSVNASNAFELINLNNVDGFLIGGASLKSESFCQIIENVTVENNSRSFMIGFLITIHAIISVLLITVVLMQASQGGGLSGLSGTQTTNAIFGGRSAGNALSKITTYLAAIFMGLALLISLIASPGSRSGSSVIEDAQQDGSLAPSTESLSLPTVPLQEDIDKD